MVQIVNAFSGESLCTLQLPRSSTVLEVKRRVQAAQGISVFQQRLVVSPAGPEVEGAWGTTTTTPMELAISCVQLARVQPLRWSVCSDCRFGQIAARLRMVARP